MKRSLALLLASLLVVFGLTACGNDKKQDQGNQDSAVVGDDTVGNNGMRETRATTAAERRLLRRWPGRALRRA